MDVEKLDMSKLIVQIQRKVKKRRAENSFKKKAYIAWEDNA